MGVQQQVLDRHGRAGKAGLGLHLRDPPGVFLPEIIIDEVGEDHQLPVDGDNHHRGSLKPNEVASIGLENLHVIRGYMLNDPIHSLLNLFRHSVDDGPLIGHEKPPGLLVARRRRRHGHLDQLLDLVGAQRLRLETPDRASRNHGFLKLHIEYPPSA